LEGARFVAFGLHGALVMASSFYHSARRRLEPGAFDLRNSPPSGARANFLEVFPNIPCLKRHEINGNYYAIKKIRSKIKTYALRSESRTAITDRKLAGRTLRECLVWEREDELSTLRAFFQIIGQPICRDSSPVLHVSNTRRF
jgi:hypothetical protein